VTGLGDLVLRLSGTIVVGRRCSRITAPTVPERHHDVVSRLGHAGRTDPTELTSSRHLLDEVEGLGNVGQRHRVARSAELDVSSDRDGQRLVTVAPAQLSRARGFPLAFCSEFTNTTLVHLAHGTPVAEVSLVERVELSFPALPCPLEIVSVPAGPCPFGARAFYGRSEDPEELAGPSAAANSSAAPR